MREAATMNAPVGNSFGAPEDDTVVLEAADAVLAFDPPPPPVLPRRRAAPRQATMTPGPMPVIQLPRRQQPSPPPSTLNSHVDKVIEYLDTFRFTLSQDGENQKRPPSDENSSVIIAGKGIKQKTHRRPSAPRGKTFRPIRTADAKSLRTVLSDSTNDHVMQNTNTTTIFRGIAKQPGPAISLANSIHSQQNTPVNAHQKQQQRKTNAFDFSFPNEYENDAAAAGGGDIESCVSNLITNMCLEQREDAAPFDWAFLDKIQGQVEDLLREVRIERETTNEWVKAVRTSVDKWVDEQRLLIDCERKHALERVAIVQQQHHQLQRPEIDNPVPPKQQKLQVIIQEQAQQIEALESRLAETTLKSSAPLVLETPRYSQLHTVVGGEDSFFASIEKQESPALPHLPQNHILTKREYATMKDGRRLIKFRNGTEREYLTDGTLITRYTNGDVKTEGAGAKDKKVVIYWHDEEETKQTIYPNGMQVYEYPNQQIERHYPDGRKEVDFPHGVRRKIRADGTKELQREL